MEGEAVGSALGESVDEISVGSLLGIIVKSGDK
jgi:hypothetical protein